MSQTVRFAGSLIRVQNGASIGRDLLAAGAQVMVSPGSVIGRDVAVGGSQTQLGGRVNRNAYMGANGIQVGGVIGGNAKMAIGDTAIPTSNLTTFSDSGLRFYWGRADRG